jgi:RNase P subunit RPR2
MVRLLRKQRPPVAKHGKELYNLEENLSKVRRICKSCGHFGQTTVSFEDDNTITVTCDHCGNIIVVYKYPDDFTKKG